MSKKNKNRNPPPPLQPPRAEVLAQQRNQVTFKGQILSGPLPHPEILSNYDSVVPGAAERIVKMAEQEQAHRHMLESRDVDAKKEESKNEFAMMIFGQLCGLIIGLAAIGAGAYVAVSGTQIGTQIAGGILGAGGVSGLVSLFIYRKKKTEI